MHGPAARIAVLLALAACAPEPGPPPASTSLLDGIPVAPASARIETTGGPEAVQATYRSGLPADSVAAWYRRWFLAEQWRITGDVPSGGNVRIIHAERDGRPVWITVQPGPGGVGSSYSLMGAAATPR